MKLLNNELKEKFESYPLYSQDGLGLEATVLCKFFNPSGLGSWFVTEASKQEDGDYIFFGYVESPLGAEFNEFGYFSLRELESVKGPYGLGIERDLYFEECKLSSLLN